MKTYLKALGLSFLLAGTEWADTLPSTNENKSEEYNISEKSLTVYNTLPPTPEKSATVYNTLPPTPEKSATVYNTLPPVPEKSATVYNSLPPTLDNKATPQMSVFPSAFERNMGIVVYNTLPPVPDYGVKTKLNLQEIYVANNQHIRD